MAARGPALWVRPRRGRGRVSRFRYRPEGFIFAAVLLCAVAGFIFSLVLLNIYLAQSSFRLAELEKAVSRQETVARQMRYRVAAAQSPARLAEAVERLGLVAPAHREHVSGNGAEPENPPADTSSLQELAASSAAMRRTPGA